MQKKRPAKPRNARKRKGKANATKSLKKSDIFQDSYDRTCVSAPIKSTRRIFFNHLDQSVAERGIFYVDLMYGAGSGILIKHEYTFYLLTADHVIANATAYAWGNESPFWVPTRADQYPSDLEAFLMPAQIIHIGETIPDRGRRFDSQDLILIELFFPSVRYMPDKFIDLDANPHAFASDEGFFQGQVLVSAGYPFEKNHFQFFEKTPEGATHSTIVNRQIIPALCEFDEDEPIMTSPLSRDTFPDLSGASGGIVTNMPIPGEDVKVLGMLVSAGPKIVRFIPSYLIAEAIANKARARITPVDPAFDGQPILEIRKIFLDLAGHDIGEDFVNPGAM